jgi:hypothetical protein
LTSGKLVVGIENLTSIKFKFQEGERHQAKVVSLCKLPPEGGKKNQVRKRSKTEFEKKIIEAQKLLL